MQTFLVILWVAGMVAMTVTIVKTQNLKGFDWHWSYSLMVVFWPLTYIVYLVYNSNKS